MNEREPQPQDFGVTERRASAIILGVAVESPHRSPDPHKVLWSLSLSPNPSWMSSCWGTSTIQIVSL